MSSEMEWMDLKDLSEKVRHHLRELKTFLRGDDKNQQLEAGIDDITKKAINQILYRGGDRDVETEIERREKTLKDGELRILIAGEQATGKSSLMNILMGGDYLPTDHFHCTAVLCELHLSSERKACVYFRDSDREPVEINNLPDIANIRTAPNINGTGWEKIWYYVKESDDTPDILKVQIFWPIPFIQHLLTLRPTSETHRSRSQARQDPNCGTPGAINMPHMTRDSATRMRELKLPDVRCPGDGASRTGSVIEDNNEIQAHRDRTNAYPAESSKIQCSNSEDVQSKARTPDITESDLSERLSHIETQTDVKSDQSEDTPVYPSISQLSTGTTQPVAHLQEQEILEENESEENSLAQGQSASNDLNSEETHPKEYYPSIYHLPTGMTPQFQSVTAVPVQHLAEGDELTNSVESSQQPNRTSSILVCSDEVQEAINVVFCDCPGITENEENSFQTTLENVETAHGIILLTDAFKPNAGIEQTKVIRLLQRIQEQLKWHDTTLLFKPLLCVCNKMDMVKDSTTRQTIKGEVQKLVAENFPTTQNISVRFLGGGELIDDQPHSKDIDDQPHSKDIDNQPHTKDIDDQQHSKDLHSELEVYLKQSFISAMEEHYLWIMNLLDLIFKVNKQKAILNQSLKKLKHDKHQEAFDLLKRMTDLDLSGNENLLNCRSKIRDFIARNKANFEIVWSDVEINDLTSHRYAGWDTISHQIDKEIVKKLKLKIERDDSLRVFRSDVEKYRKELLLIFRGHQKKLDNLKKALPGCFGSGASFTDAALPAAVQVSATAVATATLGLFLFGYAIYEECHEYHSQWSRSRFDKDKGSYLKTRTEQLLDKFCLDLSDKTVDLMGGKKGGVIYRALFNDSIRAQILYELSVIIQDRLSRDSVGSWMKRTQSGTQIIDRPTGNDKISELFDDVYKSYLNSVLKRNLTEGDLTRDNGCCGDFGRGIFGKSNGEERTVLIKTVTERDISLRVEYCEEIFLRQTAVSLPENILAFYGCCLNGDGFCLMFEDCQSDLATFIRNNPYSKQRAQREEQKREFINIGIQIAHGVRYLHDRYVCHGSLKPTNVLLKTLEDRQVVKLASVGAAVRKWLKTSEDREVVNLASVGAAVRKWVFANEGNDDCDDCQYWAPELDSQSSLRPSKESDIYSVGLILLELWFRNTVQNMRKRAVALDTIEDKNMRQLICGCLLLDPTQSKRLVYPYSLTKIDDGKKTFEPLHDKTNKVACGDTKDSDQPGYRPCLIHVFAADMKLKTLEDRQVVKLASVGAAVRKWLKTSEDREVVNLASVGAAVRKWVFANEGNDDCDDCQYWAPELDSQSSLRPSKESDIYSVGLILLELWFRNTVQNMRKRAVALDTIEDKNIRQLICGCLLLDPTQRWTAIKVHESFKNCQNQRYSLII